MLLIDNAIQMSFAGEFFAVFYEKVSLASIGWVQAVRLRLTDSLPGANNVAKDFVTFPPNSGPR